MSQAASQTQALARGLIAYEATTITAAGADPSAGTKFPGAAYRVCDKLRPHLATYLGAVGFRALLCRALALAGAKAPWLRLVQVKADGSLEGLDKLDVQVDPEEIADGGVALVAQVLALLVAFIGEDLTLQVVREVWTEISPQNFPPGRPGNPP